MKNIITTQTRFTVEHTTFKDATGCQKGMFRTRHLIKVLDNGVLLQEFTRQCKEAWVCVTFSNGLDASVECKSSEKAVKNSFMWKWRKDEGRESVLIVLN